jgi:hypothetical protein
MAQDVQARIVETGEGMVCLVGGSVVHHDEFEIGFALRQHAAHRPRKHPGAVVGGKHDADTRGHGHIRSQNGHSTPV